MGKSITQLIDEILAANQAQTTAAQLAFNAPEPLRPVRAGNTSVIYSGLSKAFNTKSGSPRYSIRALTALRKVTPAFVPKDQTTPQTYSWSPMTTMESGLTIPYLYGTMKTKGNVITAQLGGINTIGSQQNISCVLAVSKGPIESFETVSINGEVPVNVPDIANVDYRYGWNNQPILSNFNDAYETISMEDIVVAYGVPVVITNFDMSGKDDAWIYLKFPSGLYGQIQSSSDLANESCRVKVEIKLSSDSLYTTIFDDNITSNLNTAVRYYIRLFTNQQGQYFDPLDDATYDVQITKGTIDKTNDGSIETVAVGTEGAGGTGYAIGDQLDVFVDNSSTDKSFTKANITEDIITFATPHGFEITGEPFEIVNLRFKTTVGTAPTGLTDDSIPHMIINSPTVLHLHGVKTDASDDFEGKFTASQGGVVYVASLSGSAVASFGILKKGTGHKIGDNQELVMYASLSPPPLANGATLNILTVFKSTNTLQVEYITVGTRDDFAYNGIALIGIFETATETLNGSLDVSIVVKGRKVRVYTTVSAYTLIWSDNPAWVCFDVLTQPTWANASYSWGVVVGGVGGYGWIPSAFTLDRNDGIDPAEIDIQSFIDWAAHCDGAVEPPDYDPTDIKRCTFNGIFDSTSNLWDAAQSIAQNARAWLLPPSGTSKYKVVLDKVTTVTQIFTSANIVQDSLEETYTSMVDRATALQVDFLNKENDWEPETFNVVYTNAEVPREDSLNLFGITVPSQAYRRAMLDLYYNAFTPVEVKFDVNQDALNCEVGDVIGVQSELPQWGYGGRIVSSTASAVVLDREVPIVLDADYQLCVRSSSDVLTTYPILFSNNPATGDVLTNTLNGTFNSVPKLYDPYAYGLTAGAMKYKPFRVLEIKNNGDETFNIVGQEYNATIWNMDSDTPPLPTQDYSSLNALPVVVMVKLDEILILNQDGSLIDCIDVYFTRPASSAYAKAAIYYKQKTGASGSYPLTWVYAGTTNTEKFRISDVLYTETYVNADQIWYKVAVVTINTAGVKGKVDSSPYLEIQTVGKLDPPSDVIVFDAVQDDQMVCFSWTHIPDYDLWGYEIRMGGEDWDAAEVLTRGISKNTWQWKAWADGTYIFRIKAIDTTGHYSLLDKTVIITLVNIVYNMMVVYDDILEGATGTKVNMTYETTPVKRLYLNYTGDELDSLTGSYTSLSIDCFQAITQLVWIEVTSYVHNRLATDQTYPLRVDTTYPNDTDQHVHMDGGVTVIEYSLSVDNITWTSFAPYTVGVNALFQYIKIRVSQTNPSLDSAYSIYSIKTLLDMKDVVVRIKDLTVPVVADLTEGLPWNIVRFIDYSSLSFHAVPFISATLKNWAYLLHPVIKNQTKTDFEIVLIDASSESVSGTVDITAIGY